MEREWERLLEEKYENEEWDDPENFQECGPTWYIVLHVILGSWLLYYWKMAFISPFYIGGTEIWLSRERGTILLGIFLAVGCVAGVVRAYRGERCYSQIAAHEFGALGVFGLLQFSEGYPAVLPVTAIGILTAMLFRGIWVIQDVGKRLRRRGAFSSPAAEVRYRWLHFGRIWIVRGFCILGAALYSLSLMDAVDRRTFFGNGQLETAYEASGAGLIRDRWEELKLLEKGWETAGMQEKLEVLEEVLDINCSYLGIPKRPALTAEPLKYEKDDGFIKRVNGHYDEQNHEIVINQLILEECDPLDCVEVVAHESLHCWQYYFGEQIDRFPKQDPAYYAIRRLADGYAEEFAQYEDGESDYEAYFFQKVEMDAREFGCYMRRQYREIIKEHSQTAEKPDLPEGSAQR